MKQYVIYSVIILASLIHTPMVVGSALTDIDYLYNTFVRTIGGNTVRITIQHVKDIGYVYNVSYSVASHKTVIDSIDSPLTNMISTQPTPYVLREHFTCGTAGVGDVEEVIKYDSTIEMDISSEVYVESIESSVNMFIDTNPRYQIDPEPYVYLSIVSTCHREHVGTRSALTACIQTTINNELKLLTRLRGGH